MTKGIFDGGQGFADPSVVDHPAILERDIKIDPHEDVVIVEGQVANGKL